MGPQHFAQSGMQQMRGRVIQCDRLPSLAVYLCAQTLAHPDFPFSDAPDVGMRSAALLGVRHGEMHTRGKYFTCVADLASSLRIEGCAIQDELSLISRMQFLDRHAVLQQCHHGSFGLQILVTLEQRAGLDRRSSAQSDAEFRRLLRAPALFFHGRLETSLIDRQVSLARNVRREISRKAVGIVQLEHGLAVDHLASEPLYRDRKSTRLNS